MERRSLVEHLRVTRGKCLRWIRLAGCFSDRVQGRICGGSSRVAADGLRAHTATTHTLGKT